MRPITVHLYLNVLSKAPKTTRRQTEAPLKTIHAQKSFDETTKKAVGVAASLSAIKLKEAAECARGHSGNARLHEISHGAPEAHPRQQRHRAPEPRNQEAHASGRHVPRRQERSHARHSALEVRYRQRMGIKKISRRHVAGGAIMPTASCWLLEIFTLPVFTLPEPSTPTTNQTSEDHRPQAPLKETRSRLSVADRVYPMHIHIARHPEL